MLVVSINSNNNIRQYNVMYTNIHVKQLLRAYRCFSCYRNRNYEANPQIPIFSHPGRNIILYQDQSPISPRPGEILY